MLASIFAASALLLTGALAQTPLNATLCPATCASVVTVTVTATPPPAVVTSVPIRLPTTSAPFPIVPPVVASSSIRANTTSSRPASGTGVVLFSGNTTRTNMTMFMGAAAPAGSASLGAAVVAAAGLAGSLFLL